MAAFTATCTGKLTLQAILPRACIFLILFSGLRKFRLALVQLAVSADKAANITRAEGMVRKAAQSGAKIVSLPVNHFYKPLVGE